MPISNKASEPLRRTFREVVKACPALVADGRQFILTPVGYTYNSVIFDRASYGPSYRWLSYMSYPMMIGNGSANFFWTRVATGDRQHDQFECVHIRGENAHNVPEAVQAIIDHALPIMHARQHPTAMYEALLAEEVGWRKLSTFWLARASYAALHAEMEEVLHCRDEWAYRYESRKIEDAYMDYAIERIENMAVLAKAGAVDKLIEMINEDVLRTVRINEFESIF